MTACDPQRSSSVMSCALPSAVEKLGHQLFQDRHLIAQSLYLRLLGDPPPNQTAKPVRPRSALQKACRAAVQPDNVRPETSLLGEYRLNENE